MKLKRTLLPLAALLMLSACGTNGALPNALSAGTMNAQALGAKKAPTSAKQSASGPVDSWGPDPYNPYPYNPGPYNPYPNRNNGAEVYNIATNALNDAAALRPSWNQANDGPDKDRIAQQMLTDLSSALGRIYNTSPQSQAGYDATDTLQRYSTMQQQWLDTQDPTQQAAIVQQELTYLTNALEDIQSMTND